MANTNSRGLRMDKSLVIRVNEQDKAELKVAAGKRGVTVCSMIRTILINEKIISATSENPEALL